MPCITLWGGRTEAEEPGTAPTHFPATARSKVTSDPLVTESMVPGSTCGEAWRLLGPEDSSYNAGERTEAKEKEIPTSKER